MDTILNMILQLNWTRNFKSDYYNMVSASRWWDLG